MAEQQIRYDDGASYERMMGVWSWLVGDIFIDWLAPRSGLRWIDIGDCGFRCSDLTCHIAAWADGGGGWNSAARGLAAGAGRHELEFHCIQGNHLDTASMVRRTSRIPLCPSCRAITDK